MTTVSGSLSEILTRNNKYIPGGISSANRHVEPVVAFVRAQGAHLWDSEGKQYIDYHAGFAPYFLGHNFEPVNRAVVEVLGSGQSLFGAGVSALEGRLAQVVCEHVPAVDKITLLNTGSEATSLAVRLSRAVTGRSHVIVMQGGYNGNHDELACNVFNTIEEIGPRVCPGEYPLRPLGAGTTGEATRFVHPINFNDLESVRYVCRRYPVAALITEPILQNVGVVRPEDGYLEGLRRLADEYAFLLIFDEVKTGFRHALGGYSSICGVRPDLLVYGKAVANGFPLALMGGKRAFMDYLVDRDPRKKPFVAGTYNGHPLPVAAAIKTVEYLAENHDAVYSKVDDLGRTMERGITDIFHARRITGCVVRQGSAFSYYFMPAAPRDFHDIVENHDFNRDLRLRKALVQLGVFFIPIATKQCSISAAHSAADIELTLQRFQQAVDTLEV
jgi:glutamate-1-semialdehyde 2,1-aminomutase